jgi:hypothetical protein
MEMPRTGTGAFITHILQPAAEKKIDSNLGLRLIKPQPDME